MEPGNLLDLAVHEPSIVAPGPVKQLVAFYPNRETLGDVFVIDQAVAKIKKARPSATGDDLLKRIEWVECDRTHPNVRRLRPAKRRVVWIGERMIGRDEERRRTRRQKIARGYWRKFIVRLRIHIIEVAVNPELIVAHLGFESRITAPALLLGK